VNIVPTMQGDTLPLPLESVVQTRTWNRAASRWMQQGQWKAPKTRETYSQVLAWIAPHWDRLPLTAIDSDRIDALAEKRALDGVGVRSVNMVLEVIRAVLRSALRWRWLNAIPDITLQRRPPRRVRWITIEQARRLLVELPEHLRAIVVFSLETGLRKRNVLELTWAQVDIEARMAWIHADQAKARRAIAVPLSAVAVQILRDLKGTHPSWIFTYNGSRIRQSNTKAWRNALKRAGIDAFRWHDLRHTWASWHAQSGTPMNVLQELGGWASAEMVRVYAHLSTHHLQEHVDRLDRAKRQRSLPLWPSKA
jgi:integrase